MCTAIPSSARGRVARKYLHNGSPLVDVDIWAENQRGEVTAPGMATVQLPSRNPRHPWFTDGSHLSLRDATLPEDAPPILPV